MIYITSCDMDLMGFFIDLMRLYKKWRLRVSFPSRKRLPAFFL